MSERLLPSQKIRKRETFHFLYHHGIFTQGRLLNLWSYKGPEIAPSDDPPRIGIVVSRKTSTKATERNQWKRRIRESFRRQQKKVKRGIGLLIQSRSAQSPPTQTAIEAELQKLLSKADCLK